MLSLYDRALTRQSILANAYDREETLLLNGVSTYAFRLPGDDPRAALPAPLSFVRDGDGPFYRLLTDGQLTADLTERTFAAEHAIATLVDDVMFGTTLLGGAGMTTRAVLESILSRQTTRRWQLGACDFSFQYEYGFESENLLTALFAVPNLFTDPYIWDYDFRTTPWTVSLRRLPADAAPDFVLRAGRNLLCAEATRTGEGVCTRLYLLGYGEGDNQLTVSDINGGLPYIESPRAVVDKYGLISKVYVDRSFEDAQSLLERGRALLSALQEPQYTRAFDAADLSALSGRAVDAASPGDTALLTIDGTRAVVSRVARRLDVDGDMTVEMSTRPGSIADAIADLAGRQRIEQVYAQGATQLYAQSVQANADAATPAELCFFIPREMRILNKVLAKISLDRFRSYSRVTAGGGGSAVTSGGGGGAVSTSGSAGEATHTSGAGGQAAVTSGPSSLRATGQSDLESTYPNVHFTAYAGLGSGIQTGVASGQTGATSASTGSPSAVSTNSAGGGTGISGGGSTGSTRPGTTGGASPSATAYGGSSGGSHRHDYAHVHDGGSAHSHSVPAHSHSVDAHTHTMLHTHSLNNHTHSLGGHTHDYEHTHQMDHTHGFGHTHTISHTHEVQTPAHTHSVHIPGHAHSVSIPSHTHSVAVPSHTHTIQQGIFRFGSPRGARVFVGGQERLSIETEGELDLTQYLLGADGKVPRGRWIRLGVLPDDLAYVTIDIIVQGFVQSRGGGTY